MDSGVSLEAGTVMGHLALDQDQHPQWNLSYNYGLTQCPRTGPPSNSVLSLIQVSPGSVSHCKQSPQTCFLSHGGRGGKGWRKQRQPGKGLCHWDTLTWQPVPLSQGSSTPGMSRASFQHLILFTGKGSVTLKWRVIKSQAKFSGLLEKLSLWTGLFRVTFAEAPSPFP